MAGTADQQGQQSTDGAQPPTVDPTTGAAQDTSPAAVREQKARELAIAAVKAAEEDEGGDGAPAEGKKPDKPAEPEPPKEDPKYERMARGYAELEGKLRKLEKETLPSLQSDAEAFKALKARLQDPDQRYKAAEELGLDYREWTDRLVDDPSAAKSPEQKRIEALEKRLDEVLQTREQEQTEAQKAKAEADLQSRLAYAQKLVEDAGDAYAFTKALRQSPALLAKYNEMVKAGETPESEAAVAAAVEADYVALVERDLQALSDIPRFREMIEKLGYVRKSPEPARQDPKSTNQNGLAQGASTLRNEDSSEPGAGFDYSKATPQEKREHAARMAQEAQQRQAEIRGIA